MNSVARPRGFTGVWPALLTPLDAQLGIDHARFARHAQRLLDAGAGGVTPFGTTGEGPSFSVDERREAIEQLIARGIPADRIIVSTSCAALADTLALTRHAVSLGVHGCLMLPPFFFKGVSDQGVIDSYRQVIRSVAAPNWRLYVYHIPQVAGVGLSHGVIQALLDEFPGVIAGIKDSGCQRAESVALAQRFMPPLTVYVGNEPDLPTLGRLGSTGAISGIANFMPRTVTRMVMQPDDPQVANDERRIAQLLDTLKPYALLPALKGIMALLEQDETWLRVRAPLVALQPVQWKALTSALSPLHLTPAQD